MLRVVSKMPSRVNYFRLDLPKQQCDLGKGFRLSVKSWAYTQKPGFLGYCGVCLRVLNTRRRYYYCCHLFRKDELVCDIPFKCAACANWGEPASKRQRT